MDKKTKKEGLKEAKKLEKEKIPTKKDLQKEDKSFQKLTKKLKNFVIRKK